MVSARPAGPVWGRGTFPGKPEDPLVLGPYSKALFRLRVKTGSISDSQGGISPFWDPVFAQG